jgi:hypothetical protein
MCVCVNVSHHIVAQLLFLLRRVLEVNVGNFGDERINLNAHSAKVFTALSDSINTALLAFARLEGPVPFERERGSPTGVSSTGACAAPTRLWPWPLRRSETKESRTTPVGCRFGAPQGEWYPPRQSREQALCRAVEPASSTSGSDTTDQPLVRTDLNFKPKTS